MSKLIVNLGNRFPFFAVLWAALYAIKAGYVSIDWLLWSVGTIACILGSVGVGIFLAGVTSGVDDRG